MPRGRHAPPSKLAALAAIITAVVSSQPEPKHKPAGPTTPGK